MHRYVLFALSLLAAMPVLAELGYNQAATPSWVVPIDTPNQWSKQTNTPELAGLATHFKLVDQQTYVDASAQYHRFRHYVEQPLTQDGLQSSGTIEIFFKPDYQQVTLHQITIVRNGQRTDRLTGARISVLDIEPESDDNLYGGEAKVLVLVPDYRLGDTIDYQYTITGRNPVLGNKVSPSFSLGWGVPVERVYRRFTLPKNRFMQVRTENIEVQPTISETPFGRSYSLQLEHTPAYLPDPEAPGHSNIYPFIAFSEFQSWQDVGQWAKPLFQYEVPSDNTLWQQWLAQIKQRPDVEQMVTHALQLVQDNIRYVGIEIGENSHRPHPPSETLSLAYGDCKDKTLLLISLLDAVGIDAEPFLVNTNSTSALQRWLPTASSFNHVITRVKLDDRLYYIDPTLSYQAGSRISDLGYHSYAYGLSVYSAEGLTAMPARQIDSPHIAVKQVFQAYDYTLPVLLTSTATYTFEQADYQRYRFANTALIELERNYIDYYTREYGTATLARGLDFNDNRHDNEFSISIQLWVDNFYQYDADENQYEYDVYAYLPDDYLTLPDRLTRIQPYHVATPNYLSQKISIRHPTNYNPTSLIPTFTEFKNKIFTFDVSVFDLEDQSYYSFHYRNHQEMVTPEDMEQYTADVREARKYLSHNGWFNNVTTPKEATQARAFFEKFINERPSTEGLF